MKTHLTFGILIPGALLVINVANLTAEGKLDAESRYAYSSIWFCYVHCEWKDIRNRGRSRQIWGYIHCNGRDVRPENRYMDAENRPAYVQKDPAPVSWTGKYMRLVE